MPRASWDQYFLGIAKEVSKRSTCLHRQVGCLMVRDRHVLATGYNGSPAGAPHCTDIGCAREGIPSGERLDLCRGVHGEMNAVCQAARFGEALSGATAYVTIRPCAMCMRLMIQAGVKRVVWEGEYPDETTVKVAKESGFEVRNGEIRRMV